MAQDEVTFHRLITAFTDFFTVATHTILYERNIYPRTSFLSAKKYSFPVRQSRHPKVCDWINDAVAALEAELLKGGVEQVAVMIYDKSQKARERYVFDVSRFPVVQASDIDTPLERLDKDGNKIAVLPIVDMEEQFRASLSKLAGSTSSLQPLPEGCNFSIAIHLKKAGDAPVSHPQLWMPAQPRSTRNNAEEPEITTKPVRAVAAGDMIFESWIEQMSNEKASGPTESASSFG